MNDSTGPEAKPTTAARIYDYFLGGRHNFPADREAAEKVIALFPDAPAASRSNRAFLRRAVRYLSGLGINQFLDIGSGIPTVGNTHEIAQDMNPDARVVYVDLDPVAVAESLAILDGNQNATALCGDLREPEKILGHPRVTGMLDFNQPVAVLMLALLHFVEDGARPYEVVRQVMDATAPGSCLTMSHGAAETFATTPAAVDGMHDVYERRTATPGTVRTREQVREFFAGMDLVEPGVVWLPQWRPDPAEPEPLAAEPVRSVHWAAVGRKPVR